MYIDVDTVVDMGIDIDMGMDVAIVMDMDTEGWACVYRCIFRN